MTDVKRAAAFFKLIRYSYGSGCTSYGCKNFDVRKCFDTIWQASRRLADTVVENKDFEALIRQYDRDSAHPEQAHLHGLCPFPLLRVIVGDQHLRELTAAVITLCQVVDTGHRRDGVPCVWTSRSLTPRSLRRNSSWRRYPCRSLTSRKSGQS